MSNKNHRFHKNPGHDNFKPMSSDQRNRSVGVLESKMITYHAKMVMHYNRLWEMTFTVPESSISYLY